MPVQSVEIIFDGDQCVASRVDPAVEGETLSFTFINRTDKPAIVTLASSDSQIPTDVLLTDQETFREHAWAHNWWIVPPHEEYEMRATFEGAPYGSGLVLCSESQDATPIIAVRFPVANS